jgi:hypothetical protein
MLTSCIYLVVALWMVLGGISKHVTHLGDVTLDILHPQPKVICTDVFSPTGWCLHPLTQQKKLQIVDIPTCGNFTLHWGCE